MNIDTSMVRLGGGMVEARQVLLPLKLVVTTKITGYTCQYIYGDYEGLIPQPAVVPTYQLEIKKDGKSLSKTFSVTRDGWYSRGVIKKNEKKDKYGKIELISQVVELTNRHFEPPNDQVNLYSGVALVYPHLTDLEAYALRRKGEACFPAEKWLPKMNSRVSGAVKFDEPRTLLDQACEVMIHVGGWYKKGSTEKLGGSYGCFSVIPPKQIYTKNEAEEHASDGTYKTFGTANSHQKEFIKYVVDERGERKVHILIKKRSGVKRIKTITVK